MVVPGRGGIIEPRTIVIGASAGGVEALTRLVRDLPGDLPAALLVVLHVAPAGTSVLPDILSRAGRLLARHAEDGAPITPSVINVAPPDCHLMVEDGIMRVGRGPKENGHRPAIDPLFRSAGANLGARAIGLILSGVLDDGAAGLRALRARGGVAIVQDPADALYGAMPQSAIDYAQPDHVLPLEAISRLLIELAHSDPGPDEADVASVASGHNPHPPSGLTCPECNGALWEVSDGDLIRFECRVGHAYNINSLVVEQAAALEAALWGSLRALEERVALARRLAERADERGRRRSTQFFNDRAAEADRHADAIRRVLDSIMTGTALPDEESAA